MEEKNRQNTRPAGVTALSVFFMIAAAITSVAAVSLIFPRSFLEPIWQLNPRGHAGLVAVGVWAVILLLSVGAACAAAAIGLWRGRRWGYVLTIVILLIHLISDIINVVSGIEPRAAIGVPIIVVILVYLRRKAVRSFLR